MMSGEFYLNHSPGFLTWRFSREQTDYYFIAIALYNTVYVLIFITLNVAKWNLGEVKHKAMLQGCQ